MQVQSRRRNLSAGRAFFDQPSILNLFRIILFVVLVSAALLFIRHHLALAFSWGCRFLPLHGVATSSRANTVPRFWWMSISRVPTLSKLLVIAVLGPGPDRVPPL